MKFIVTYTIRPENYKATMARFKKTGAQPPKGVNLLGRWTRPDLGGGFSTSEVGTWLAERVSDAAAKAG